MLSIFYQEFLEGYMEEAYQDLFLFEATKGEHYYLRDNMQLPLVKNKLKEKSVQNQIIEFTGRFIDQNSAKFSTTGPVHIVGFLDKDINFFYDLFGTDKETTVKQMKEMKDIAYGPEVTDNVLINVKNMPHKLLITAILVDAIQNNYEDIIECCTYIFGFIEYPIQYRNFWKLGVKEDVMNYTIENLPSNKFKAKRLNNLLALLKYDVNSSIEFFKEQLAVGKDETYIDFNNRVRNQIRNTFVNIANYYYKNYEENLTLNTLDSHYDDGKIAEYEGQSQIIANSIDRAYNKIMSSNVDPQIVKIISQASEIDPENLKSYLNLIIKDKRNRLEKMIENCIVIYFQKNPEATSVGTGEFLNFGLGLYRSIPGSKDKLYIELRTILDFWMNEIVKIKTLYKGSTTINSYTRGVFNYFIMMINHFN